MSNDTDENNKIDDMPVVDTGVEESVEKDDITADNLPLDVREHLMRGNLSCAISVLENDHSKTKSQAEQLIADYRENLRQRKVALEIQIMNEKSSKEEDRQKQNIIRWVSYGITALILMILLYMMRSH